MTKRLIKDALGWGVGLWAFGYVLGIILYKPVPTNVVGWVIMPFGVVATLWVLLKKVRGGTFRYYLTLGIVWAILAMVLDYVLLVKAFHPADGYYKLDVYLYYVLTLVLPLLVGWRRAKPQFPMVEAER